MNNYIYNSRLRAPSAAPGELFLVAEINRLVGLDLDPETTWILAAATNGPLPALSDEELQALLPAKESRMGFTAGIAALRYSQAEWLPAGQRCKHAQAVSLAGTRQSEAVISALIERDADSEDIFVGSETGELEDLEALQTADGGCTPTFADAYRARISALGTE